jgi:cyclic pyranopterin phosphate synthase
MEGETSEGPVKPGLGSPLLTPEDYYIIAKAGSLVGVSKFKITGGEPLLRKDIIEIVRAIKQASPYSEVSMTTNGFFLGRYISQLAEAGMERVNISLHSLNKEVYEFITGVPGLDKALEGFHAAIEHGVRVKINMVVLKGVNESEILSMASFANKHGAILQLIELHPVGLGAKFFNKYFYPLKFVEEKLERLGARKTYRSLHNRPLYTLPDGSQIEIVRPVGNPFFCAGCTRIRIGPYGDLLPCLNWTGPRPIIIKILRDKSLSEKEKIVRIAQEIIDLVSRRKPFYMCTLENCREKHGNTRISRISFSKRSSYERMKRELESLLAEGAVLERRVQGPALGE